MPPLLIAAGALVAVGVAALPVTPGPTPTPVKPGPATFAPPPAIVGKTLAPYVSFVSGRRAIQVPVRILSTDSPTSDLSAAVRDLPHGEALLVAFRAPATTPLVLTDIPDNLVVVYVSPDDIVSSVRALTAGAPVDDPLPPYALALVAPATQFGADTLIGGERLIRPAQPLGPAPIATIPLPPVGTLPAYPGPAGGLTPTTRPTVGPSYPSPSRP